MLSKKLKFLLLAVITFFGAYYFFKKGSEFVQLIDLSIQNIFFLSIAVLLSYFFYGFKLKNLCDPFDIHLPAREWIGLPMILHLGNLIFFKAGTVTLAIYLKNHYQLPYTKFVAIMTAEKTFLLYSMCLLGFAFTFLFDISSSRQIYSIIIFCTLITILTWIFFLYSL